MTRGVGKMQRFRGRSTAGGKRRVRRLAQLASAGAVAVLGIGVLGFATAAQAGIPAGTRAGHEPLGTLGGRGGLLAPFASVGGSTARLPFGRLSVPSPGTRDNQLQGVTCTSSNNCWAVGSYLNGASATLNDILHWTGSSWSVATVPNPGGTASSDSSSLRSVYCTSSSHCWAVGYWQPSGGASNNQVLRWNGSNWTLATTPDPGGTSASATNRLLGITCTSATNCWAVGVYGSGSGTLHNEALRWNGTKWSKVGVPSGGGAGAAVSELTDVACPTSASCLAVGVAANVAGAELNEVVRWNGTKWSAVAGVPDPGTTAAAAVNVLFSITCPSTTNCWAAGGYVSYDSARDAWTQILHWNGKSWTTSRVPQVGIASSVPGTYVQGVRCTSASNCWAVGQYMDPYTATVNQALHWNGSAWSLIPTPNPGGIHSGDYNQLIGVGCSSASSCWAVGTEGGTGLNEALRWNGTGWTIG